MSLHRGPAGPAPGSTERRCVNPAGAALVVVVVVVVVGCAGGGGVLLERGGR